MPPEKRGKWRKAETLPEALFRLAVRDWRRPTVRARLEAAELGFESLQEELLAFFQGEWCRELLTLLGCEELDILQEIRRRDSPLG